MRIEIRVPDIGEFDEVEVVEVLVSAGSRVEADESLITLESDKASMDIPAPSSGRVVQLHVAVGDLVGEGSLILELEVDETRVQDEGAPNRGAGAGTVEPPQATVDPSPEVPTEVGAPSETTRTAPGPSVDPEPSERARRTAPPPPPEEARRPGRLPHASPSVRRFAHELGVDLQQVRGSGRKGRILREDVQAFVRARLDPDPAQRPAGVAVPQVPAVDFSRYGEVEEVPLGRIRRLAARNVHRSWLAVPHVTHHDEADITEMDAFRRKMAAEAPEESPRLSLLPFVMKAATAALQRFPRVNSSLAPDGDSLIQKRYYNLGIAVDTELGLVVPVVRDVDRKGLLELAAELAAVSARARAGKLSMDDLQGASFTISSLGGIGGTAFTPIVNAPEAAILGVSRACWRPVYREGELAPRLRLPLSLSFDHRVIDGAEAARFTRLLGELLGDLRRLLL